MKLLWLGDFFYNYDYVANDIVQISNWIKNNNYKTILNLEGCICSDSDKPIKKRGPNLSSNKVSIEILKKLNVIGVCMANNHIMDFGKNGLIETIKILDENNIKHTGAGLTLNEALIPMFFKFNKTKIAILNYGWNIEETIYATFSKAGCAPRNEKIIFSQLNKYKNSVDEIIVCMHWGFEYNRLPMPYDISLAHKIIDNGANIIIGHHPHCIQPLEIYKNHRIYYSLGNFYFSNRRENFNKVFTEKIKNQSDYGIGVIWDINNNFTNVVYIYYDREIKKSNLLLDFDNSLLEPLDYNRNYLKQVKKRKVNFNPILTNNVIINKIKLSILTLNYTCRKLAKILLKRR